VTSALEERLGAAAFSAGVPGLLAAKRWLWPGVSVLAAGAVGGALFLLARTDEAPPDVPPAPPAASVAPPPAPPVVEAPPAEAPVVEAPPVPSVSASATSRRDRLAEEVAMLSRATGALNGGRASDALRVLDEHARKFPNGALTEERRGARAQALCALGMRADAEKELVSLARTSPRSPHLARARKLCGSAAGAK
jgi:hypothetical protein